MKAQPPQIAVLGLVALVAVGALMLWSNSSKQGTISVQKSKIVDSSALGKTLDGANFVMKYPNIYAKHVLQPKDNNIEIYELFADTVYDKRLSVEITRLPSGVLSDDGNYNLRRVHPEKYTERLRKTADTEAHIMVTVDGKEETVFMVHGAMLATLAFVTDSPADKLQTEVDGVVDSFDWKK